VVLCLVTLRKGAKEGLIILFCVSAASVMLSLFYQSAIQYTLAGYVLAWLLAVTLQATVSWARVLELAALLGIMVVAILHWYMGDLQQYWVTFLNEQLTVEHWDSLLGSMASDGVDTQAIISTAAQFLTGAQVIVILLSALANLLLARWLQAILYNPDGLAQELHTLRLSWLANGFLLIVVVGLFSSAVIAYDLLPVVVLPFFLTGLSVIHFIANLGKLIWLWLVSFYSVLILFFPYVLGLLVLLAIMDTGFDIRRLVTQAKKTLHK